MCFCNHSDHVNEITLYITAHTHKSSFWEKHFLQYNGGGLITSLITLFYSIFTFNSWFAWHELNLKSDHLTECRSERMLKLVPQANNMTMKYDALYLRIIWPDGSMAIQVVSQMILYKIFARHSQINWVPVFKFLLQLVQSGFGDCCFRELSSFEVNVVPHLGGHLLWLNSTWARLTSIEVISMQ